MMLEVLKQALEKIANVNAMDYEYQRWAREALAIAELESQEPKCVVIVEVFGKDWRLEYMSLPVGKHKLYAQQYLYTHPPQRKPLTDEQMFDLAEIAWRHGWASCRDAEYIGEEAEDERWGMIGAEVVQNMAAHGIKE